MTTIKFRENAFLWLLAGCAVIVLLVGGTADKEPEGFFVGIRAVVCFASVFAAVKAYTAKRETWTWLLGANAALYNPFVLVHLTRDTWQLLDFADIVLIVAAAVVLRVRGVKVPRPVDIDGAPVAAPPPKVRAYRTPTVSERVLWCTLLVLCLAGAFLSQYAGIPADATEAQKQAHNQQTGSVTFGLAFWGYLVARLSRWRRPGRVALGSFLAGLVTVLAGAAAGGYARGTERNDEMSGVLVQIGQFDPALEARFRAGKGEPLAPMMQSSLKRALVQAPDEAVVAFAHQRFALIQGDSTKFLKRCVSALNGRGDYDFTASEQQAMMRVVGNLFSAAAGAHPAAQAVGNRSPSPDALAAYQRADPDDVLDDEAKRNALSEPEQCGIYTRVMNALLALPVKDAAPAIRATMVSG